MFNVCIECGMYRADKQVDPLRSVAICPECGREHPFKQLPLLLIGGASGAGKSTVLQHLVGSATGVVPLEADILWQSPFNLPEENYRTFFETWLRLAKNIGQSGRPVAIFGAGFCVPGNVEPCVERRYFGAIHYLALVCEENELRRRLLARPAWRESGGETFIQQQVAFNRWLRAEGPAQTPRVDLIEVTGVPVEETARAVSRWLRVRAGVE